MTDGATTGPAKNLALEAFVPGSALSRLAASPGQALEASAHPFECALIFVDISGFTALTEGLAVEGGRGAEEVRELLNACFAPLVDLILAHGGLIEKFAGDATLALWPVGEDEGGDPSLSDAVRRAVGCAREIQAGLNGLQVRETQLHLKTAVVAGESWATLTGGVEGRWESMVAGQVIAQIGPVLAQAGPGDLVISSVAVDLCGTWLEGRRLAGGGLLLEHLEDPLPPRPLPAPQLEAASRQKLKAFVPFSIQSRLEAGHTGWLAEFRRVTILFVNLGTGPFVEGSLGSLHGAIRALQRSIYRFGGGLNQLVTDDKGTCLIAAWGLAFRNYDDNASRSLRAAMDMRDTLIEQGVELSVGVATGQIYTGLRGGSRRLEYAMIGDAVNLAARLMQTAEEGAIICDRYTKQAATGIDFEALEPVQVKGKARPIQIFRPLGKLRGRTRHQVDVLGRRAEQDALRAQLDELEAGRGSTVILEGEAGIGKSYLTEDLLATAESRGLRVLDAEGDAIEQAKPYFPWQDIFGQLIGLDSDDVPESRKNLYDTLLPEERGLAALLTPILPFEVPETDKTEGLTAKGRAEACEDLMVAILRRSVQDHATVIVIDDGHWLDSASWGLLEAVHSEIPNVMVLVATRPLLDRDLTLESRRLLQDSRVVNLRLGPLKPDEVLDLVRLRLKVDALPTALEEALLSKGEGHPLFTEELAFSLRDRGLITVRGRQCRVADQVASLDTLSFPNTAQDVVTGRIDILNPHQQLTLKVASVLGRRFSLEILRSVHPIAGEREDLPVYLNGLAELELVQQSDEAGHYEFKHAITQEAAYELLPFAQRRELHRSVAEWHEEERHEDLSTIYGLLAYHWSHAEVSDKALTFLEKAGLQAESGYAYKEVARFFAKALEIDEGQSEPSDLDHQVLQLPGGRALTARAARSARWRRILGFAHANLGQLEDGERELRRSLELLGEDVPDPGSSWGMRWAVLREVIRQTRHRLRSSRIEMARGEAADCMSEGARVYSRLGAFYYVSNHLPGFMHGMLAGLNMAEHVPPSPELAASYSDVCNVAGLIPLHSLARSYVELALKVARQVDHSATTARVLSRTAIYLSATADWSCLENLEESIRLAERLGDPYQWEESVYLLGLAECYRGDFESAHGRAQRVVERSRRSGNINHEIWGAGMIAESAMYLGCFDEASEAASEARRLIEESQSVNRDTLLRSFGAEAMALWRSERHDEALRAADEVREVLKKKERTAHVALQGYVGASEVYCRRLEMDGPSSAGRHDADLLVEALGKFSKAVPVARPLTGLMRGRLAAIDGKDKEADRHLRAALEEAQGMELRYTQGRLQEGLFRLHENDAPRRAAVSCYASCGARHDVERLSGLADRSRPT